MNRLGIALHKVITIVSGARTPEGNTGVSGSHHIPGNNPSGMGEAVDAYIGSKALASVVAEKTLKRYGLYSGNRPGFYKGQPDPEHIETIERRTGEGYTGSPKGSAPSQPAPAQDTTVPAIQDAQIPGGPPDPGTTVAPVMAPGSLQADVNPSQRLADTWQLLSADPLASQETQNLARKLGQSSAA